MHYPSPFASDIAFEIAKVQTQPKPKDQEKCLEILDSKPSKKRIREFCAGRIAAKLALAQLDFKMDKFLSRDLSGLTIWPPGFVGSISHSNKYALAAVARSKQYLSLGLDIEFLDRPKRFDISRKIASATELSWINTSAPREHAIIRLFSAKEAVYKALFPLGYHQIGFHDVEMNWDTSKSEFKAFLKPGLARDLENHFPLRVKCVEIDTYTIAGLALKNTEH